MLAVPVFDMAGKRAGEIEIDPARLDSMGLGESNPMMDGIDSQAMRRNRRAG